MKGCAYVDTLDQQSASHATHMLSYTWGYRVGDIVDALSAHCELTGLDPKETYIWICCLCINQHRVKEASARGETVPFEVFEAEFRSRVQGVGHVLAMMEPWFQPKYLTRVWCVYELFVAEDLGIQLDILMPPREGVRFAEALMESTDGLVELRKTMDRVRVEDAQATVQADRDNIFRLVQAGPGFARLNATVTSTLRSWVARTGRNTIAALLHEHEASSVPRLMHAAMGYAPEEVQAVSATLALTFHGVKQRRCSDIVRHWEEFQHQSPHKKALKLLQGQLQREDQVPLEGQMIVDGILV
jgi:hypothetical protein